MGSSLVHQVVVELKWSIKECGVLCVILIGILMLQMWSVREWDGGEQSGRPWVPSLDAPGGQYGWILCVAVVTSPLSKSVVILGGVWSTVPMATMQAWSVQVRDL